MLRFSIFLQVISIVSGTLNGSRLGNEADCHFVTMQILATIHRENFAGQVLASREWLEKGSEKVVQGGLPWLVYDAESPYYPGSNTTLSSSISIRFTSSNFIHLEFSSSSSSSLPSESPFQGDSLLVTSLKKFLYLYTPFKLGIGAAHLQGLGDFAIRKLKERDLLITLFNCSTRRSQGNGTNYLLRPRVSHRHHFHIWLSCTGTCPKSGESPSTFAGNPPTPLRLYSSKNALFLLTQLAPCKENPMHISNYFRSVLGHTPSNASMNWPESDLSPVRKALPVSSSFKPGILYSSLVFIAKKVPESPGAPVWAPFTLTSWIGILAAYTVTAIFFGVIKIVTMNNLENSWYDCIINQFVSFVNDGKGDQKGSKNGSESSESSPKKGCSLKPTSAPAHLRRISVRSIALHRNSTVSEMLPNFSQSPHFRFHKGGKISKSILYGMIRIASFLLLAMYEGKLYNTITFPKSKLLASFDDLVTGGTYVIKLSPEAAKFENVSKFRSSLPSFAGGLVENRTSKYVESVNILDCVNWVDSAPDPRQDHACVGYEFELRNLHKAQKSDKILVKSKHKLVRFGSSTSISRRFRRRGFTMFPGGFQISKWILESGILQLWSVVENAFMESIVNPNWSDPLKVFTIRDYLGLFVVYSLLLSLASIMFLLEQSISLAKRIARHPRAKRAWDCLKSKLSRLKGVLSRLVTSVCCHVPVHVKVKCRNWRRRKYFRSARSTVNASITV